MLKKENRISSSILFKQIFTQGARKENKYFRIIFKKNNLDCPRYGIIVSSRISKSAVQRNILKRKIRNILRDLTPTFYKGLDIVVITKQDSLKINFPKLKESLSELLLKLS